VVTAKLRDDRLLSFLDNEKTGAQPDQSGNRPHQANAELGMTQIGRKTAAHATGGPTPLAATIAALAKEGADLLVEISPQLIEVRGATLG
jgi:hypothetical protein